VSRRLPPPKAFRLTSDGIGGGSAGWVERSELDHSRPVWKNFGGFALLNPPYVLRNARSAREWLMAEGTAAGRPRRAVDMINAATAAANSCTVVTADYNDFRGAANCFNPLTFRG
jgi:hypothetical protein